MDPAKKKGETERWGNDGVRHTRVLRARASAGRPGVIEINRRPFRSGMGHFDGIAVEEVGGPSPA